MTIGEDQIEWVKHTRLLDVTINDRFSWSHHLIDVKMNFFSQTEPPEKEFVLEKKRPIGLILQDNIILPSVLYGLVRHLGRLP